MNEGGVLAIPHPNAFFDERISELICPNRDFSIELKFQYREMAFRRNRSACPPVGGKRVCFSVDVDEFIETGNEKSSSRGRIQCRDQQTVIAPRGGARDRTGGEPSDAIRD